MKKKIILFCGLLLALTSALALDNSVPRAVEEAAITNSPVPVPKFGMIPKFSTVPFRVISSPEVTSIVANIILEDFEQSLSKNWVREMANSSYSGTFSTNFARSGTYSLRVELRNTDPYVNGSLRSGISIMKPETTTDERTYSFSILLPKGGDEDYALDPKGDEIIAKWRNTPDPGEEWTYPPLSLHTSGDGHYHLYVCWDDKSMSTQQEMDADGKVTSYDLGTYIADKGHWTDWTFHIRWGWLASQQPIIQISKDGNTILELIDIPNTTNDQKGVHMQLGIGKSQWTVSSNPSILTRRVIYYDYVSIK